MNEKLRKVAKGVTDITGTPPFVQGFIDHLLDLDAEQRRKKLLRLFACVGDELNLGESREEWNRFYEKIDNPEIHTAVLDAVRQALESFDEAPSWSSTSSIL